MLNPFCPQKQLSCSYNTNLILLKNGIRKELEIQEGNVKLSTSIGFDFFNFSTSLQSRREKSVELAVPHNVDRCTLYKPGPSSFSNTAGSRCFRVKNRIINNLNPNVGFILLSWFNQKMMTTKTEEPDLHWWRHSILFGRDESSPLCSSCN